MPRMTLSQARATEIGQSAGTLGSRETRKSMIGLEATKAFALNLKLSDPDCSFGTVKKGYRYQCSKTLTNLSCSGMRWRIQLMTKRSKEALNDTTDYVRCVTPRGRLAPGVSVKLTFELLAAKTGRIFLSFQIQGEEDALRADPRKRDGVSEDKAARSCRTHLRCSATILPSKDFRDHICRMRYERLPLLARGVTCEELLPPSRVEIEAGDVAERLVDEDRAKARHEAEAKQDVLAKLFGVASRDDLGAPDGGAAAPPPDGGGDGGDDDRESLAPSEPGSSVARNDWLEGVQLPPEAISLVDGQFAEDAAELAILPFFPECVWDPRTMELKLDAPQRRVVVDASLSLEECVAAYDARRSARMGVLEKGGLLTGRALDEFSRRRLSPRTMTKIASDALLPQDALDELNDDQGSDPGVGKRSKTMVFLDLKKRSVDKAAA